VAGELGAVMQRHRRPIVVHSMFADGEAATRLRADGIAVFRRVESATTGLGLLAAGAAAHTGRAGAGAATGEEAGAGAERPVAPGQTGYWSCRQLVASAGLAIPAGVLVADHSGLAAARRLRFPVVLKAGGLRHKSDVGGVVLDLADAPALERAYARMQAELAPPMCTVEEMLDVRAGVELIVGVRRDPRFGPVVMVGLGGVLAELHNDRVLALAPVSAAGAESMLGRLRLAALLTGFRGRARVDLDAAGAAVAALSRWAERHPEVAEVEVNPLLVETRGAWALDARIVLGTEEAVDAGVDA
jgi:acyl-CoA synthetase (NDP forming)